MRNSDRYRTAKERAEAFIKYCFKNDVYSNTLNAFTWLDLESPDEDPLPCPFCDVFAKLRKSVAEIHSENITPDNTGAFNEDQLDESFDYNEW